jgi:hypothetical protein
VRTEQHGQEVERVRERRARPPAQKEGREMAKRRVRWALIAGAAAFVMSGSGAWAFTQKSPVTPIGHEWLTVEGAKAIAKEFPELNPPKNEITGKSAACRACDQYGTKSHAVWSAVMGQRWIDIMGFVKEKALTPWGCLDPVAQDPEEVQYDHFLRGRKDVGDQGREKAIRESIQRFERYFLAAAAAKDETIWFTDGGAAAADYKALKPYFYFGRALHLFQDSFSPEHAVRDGSKVYDIKSYLCTEKSLQHVHDLPVALLKNYGVGDVLWKSPVKSASRDNLRPHGELALRATTDLWRAFMRARKSTEAAKAEVKSLLARWFVRAEPSSEHKRKAEDGHKGCKAKGEQEIRTKRDRCLKGTYSRWDPQPSKREPRPAYGEGHLPPFRH